jgi:hypothetical protein
MERQTMLASADDIGRCWVGIASCLKKGHEMLFSTPKQTSEIINKREYDPLLRILQKLLDEWRRDFDTANCMYLLGFKHPFNTAALTLI